MDKQLPPLPPSDPASMRNNHYDAYYDRRSREYWGQAEISQNEVKPFQKCDHYFFQADGGVVCNNCHAGWTGPLQAKEGKLFVNGEPVILELAH